MNIPFLKFVTFFLLVVLVFCVFKGVVILQNETNKARETADKEQIERVNEYVKKCNEKGGSVKEYNKGFFSTYLLCDNPKKI